MPLTHCFAAGRPLPASHRRSSVGAAGRCGCERPPPPPLPPLPPPLLLPLLPLRLLPLPPPCSASACMVGELSLEGGVVPSPYVEPSLCVHYSGDGFRKAAITRSSKRHDLCPHAVRLHGRLQPQQLQIRLPRLGKGKQRAGPAPFHRKGLVVCFAFFDGN